MGRHRSQDPARLVDAAAKRQHQLEIVQPHHLAHPLHRCAFERKGFGVGWMDVARSTTKTNHRILFMLLKVAPAQQRRIFVAFEV